MTEFGPPIPAPDYCDGSIRDDYDNFMPCENTATVTSPAGFRYCTRCNTESLKRRGVYVPVSAIEILNVLEGMRDQAQERYHKAEKLRPPKCGCERITLTDSRARLNAIHTIIRKVENMMADRNKEYGR